jgi:hypothetical protein
VRSFRGLFGTRPDPLTRQAEILVEAARINAIGSFVPLLDEFPLLQEANPEHWDFILTIAGVFIAATRLRNLHLDHAREDKLSDIISEYLYKSNSSQGASGFDDCKSFFERTYDALEKSGHEPRFTASDAIGSWIIWNVLSRAPETEEEQRLMRAVGMLITHRLYDWWNP